MTVLISLIGEQAAPNLLPVRYLQPDQTVQVYTDRTEPVAKRLQPLLEHPAAGYTSTQALSLKVPAFEMPAIQDALKQFIAEQHWAGTDLIFNLTGGTKPMAFAAHQLASLLRSRFVYLESQGGQSRLYQYAFSPFGDLQKIEENPVSLPTLLNLDEYLRAYLGNYEEEAPSHESECLIHAALAPVVDECKTSVRHGGALEIDLVLRCGNQVGIVEVKTGKNATKKEGIDQLTTAAEQRYLGTYTRKFLVMDRELGSNNRDLAMAHRINIVELNSLTTGTLSEEDKTKLIEAVLKSLGVTL